MWNDANDKIMDILNYFNATRGKFPAVCPICKKDDGHIFFYTYRNNGISSAWVWCSSCRYSAHFTYRTPSIWKNMLNIDSGRLASAPDYLEEIKHSIDDWVNTIIESAI